MNTSTRARTSSSSTHPFLKTGNSLCHSNGCNVPYSKVGGLRRRASDQRYERLVHGDNEVIFVD
jgi:hypothetical protein